MGKEKLLAFGVWPEVSLTEARKKRNEAKLILKSGKDPSVDKKNQKLTRHILESNTFVSIYEEWLEKKRQEWRTSYFDDVKRAIEIHLLPDLGARPIDQIIPAEIIAVLKKIEDQGKYEAAHRARQKCEAIFRYAVISQRCVNNPASNLKGVCSVHARAKK